MFENMDVGMKGDSILTRRRKKKKTQEYDIKLNCLYWTIFRRKLLRFQSGPKNPKQIQHSFNQFSLQIY